MLLLLGVPVVGTYVMLTIARVHVEDRFVSFLLFHVIVVLALGVAGLCAEIRRLPPLKPLAMAVAVLLVLLGLRHVANYTRIEAETPYENYQSVGHIVRDTGIYRVVTNSGDPEDLRYYIGRHRVTVPPLTALQTMLCSGPGPLIYVDHHDFGFPEPDLKCVRDRGATLIHVNQQGQNPASGNRGKIDVWVLSGTNGQGP